MQSTQNRPRCKWGKKIVFEKKKELCVRGKREKERGRRDYSNY